jgi:hypothetical protein
MQITHLSALASSAGPTPLDTQELVSLDQGLINTLARSVQGAQLDKQSQLVRLEQVQQVTDPDKLAVMQVDMAQYTVQLSMINTLSRKGVMAVETLVKS